MGRKKKTPAEKLTYVTVGFYAEELRVIHRTMDTLGVSFGAAVRMLVRSGARGPATSPFTPTEGHDHDD